ncbi:MAG TPA: mannosyltransferase family protein [Candidatus Binataceae bacterium]|nr:mannosyltransferase family protein [Candidatus Binataceae bacterium]
MSVSNDRRHRSILGMTVQDWSVAAMVLALKAVVLIFGAMAFQIASGERVAGFAGLLTIWNRWDGPQYLLIAEHGYAPTGDQRLALAFFPLYPWTIRLVAVAVRDPVLSAFLISTVASVAAGVMMARLVALDASRRLAWRAAWLLFIFPTSYFLHTDYSESLFLALVLASFIAARRERWLAAGAIGALAALTRPNGILLLPALGADALWTWWKTRRFNWRWSWTALVLCGLAAYLAVNYRTTGDAFAFLGVQREHWSHSLVPPWSSIRVNYQIGQDPDATRAAMIGTQVLLYLAIGLAGTVVAIFSLRPSYAAWMGLNWIFFVTQSWDISAPRYTLMLFPLFILIARLARRRIWDVIVTSWSLLWLGLFVAEFVRGHWAF